MLGDLQVEESDRMGRRKGMSREEEGPLKTRRPEEGAPAVFSWERGVRWQGREKMAAAVEFFGRGKSHLGGGEKNGHLTWWRGGHACSSSRKGEEPEREKTLKKSKEGLLRKMEAGRSTTVNSEPHTHWEVGQKRVCQTNLFI